MPGEGGSYDSHFTSGRSATAVSTAGPWATTWMIGRIRSAEVLRTE